MSTMKEKPVLKNIKTQNYVVFAEKGVKISDTEIFGAVYIGSYTYMNSGIIRSYCEVGRYCSIGRNVSIGLGHHNVNRFSTSPFFEIETDLKDQKLAQLSPKRRVIIGNDVWIGDNVLINSGVIIGDGCVIGAGAVVTKSVESYSIMGGVPAKLLRKRFKEETIVALLESKWWKFSSNLLRSLKSLPSVEAFLQALRENEENEVEEILYDKLYGESYKR